ncbi:Manganese/iron superoxide dismutase, C-terminal,Manganese/iron superoxide dismutase, binding [Cinara cedri]|uniref:superoxide dismutase n=1 Tax=Cinara cedri TaxID=506608 RepID=A0A5E4MGN6_9HEMI|nr:Manganese/iron superoxide dismutase, C-terminal,Manganese/iron superoxide dismutase, binding [Cinara cedri]
MAFKRIIKSIFDHGKQRIFPLSVSRFDPLKNLKITNSQHVHRSDGLPSVMHAIKPVKEELQTPSNNVVGFDPKNLKRTTEHVIRPDGLPNLAQIIKPAIKEETFLKNVYKEIQDLSKPNFNVKQNSFGIADKLIMGDGNKKRAGRWLNMGSRVQIRSFGVISDLFRDPEVGLQANLLQALQGKLQPLKYEYNALEPIISREIMEMHHKEIHNTYIVNFNKTLIEMNKCILKRDMSKVESLEKVLKFNFTAIVNHNIYFRSLTPHLTKPSSELKNAIVESFGSLEELKRQMTSVSVSIQGKGWCWLVVDPRRKTKKLMVTSTQNEDCILLKGLPPVLGIDVWEHAYYSQYKSARADYVDAIFDIINWEELSVLFDDFNEIEFY